MTIKLSDLMIKNLKKEKSVKESKDPNSLSLKKYKPKLYAKI